MLININGKSEEVKIELNLAEIILSKSLCAEKVVIEHNLRIVPKDEWENTHLQENDRIEIVSFVGGG
jgi:sulfur carrier protein